jgi:hypothetical protein
MRKGREQLRRLSTEEIKALYEELIVSLQCGGGNAGALIPQFADGVPGWFRAAELGLALDAGPSILTTVFGGPGWWNGQHVVEQLPLSEQTARARQQARHTLNALIKAKLGASPSKILRARLKPIAEPRGCTGCVACVPDARLRPIKQVQAERLATWTPRDPNALGRWATRGVERRRRLDATKEQRRQLRDLTRGARDLRRLENNEIRAKAGKPPIAPRRSSTGRSQMAQRRAEQHAMRAVVRRAVETVTDSD